MVVIASHLVGVSNAAIASRPVGVSNVVVSSHPMGVSNVAVTSRPMGVSNPMFSPRGPSSAIFGVFESSGVDGGNGNVGLDAEFVAATPISKGIYSYSSPCAPMLGMDGFVCGKGVESVAGGGLPAPPPGGNRPNVGVFKKVASVAKPFPICRSISISQEEDTVVEIDQDSLAATTVPLMDEVASPMVGGIVSLLPEVAIGGLGCMLVFLLLRLSLLLLLGRKVMLLALWSLDLPWLLDLTGLLGLFLSLGRLLERSL
ncbi:hypothetical protein SUGI_0239020 [Cryptomeria japonica]|nr:hypothetical protein SUGI_0239020 [Cryptomeria japonica]